MELSGLAHSMLQLYLIGIDQNLGDVGLRKCCQKSLERLNELEGREGSANLSPQLNQVRQLALELLDLERAGEMPKVWAQMMALAGRNDGLEHHASIEAQLPTLDGVNVRVDALLSEQEKWWLYVDAASWLCYEGPYVQSWGSVPVVAEDDRGGRYLGHFDGLIDWTADSAGPNAINNQHRLIRMLPRLDPDAKAVKLIFASESERAVIEIQLCSPS